ncbi:MAG TPA: ABC transporter permease subunit [Candidatus Dormibacteraeota bacterium]|nr:ABC transporter permease subunit [Candidatus Dormibacteraeota bacterium]
MTAIRFGLRLGRWGPLGFSFLTFASSLIQAVGFYQIAGHTAASRAAFAQSMSQLAAQLTFILPPPAGLSTVGGYVEWRAFGGLAILFGVWALVSGSGATRGDEERGLVEAVLASGVTRSRWLASRVIGYAAMALIAALAGGLGLVAGVAVGGESINLGPVVEICVALAALGLSCYSLTVLIAQVVGARVATAAAGVVLLALFLVNRLSQTFTWLAAWRWISPFHYYELNQPLAPGGAFDARAALTMLGIATVGAAVAAVAFEWRDLGAPLVRWPSRRSPAGYEASRSPLWRIPVVRGLYERRAGLATWAVALAALAVLFVYLTKTVLQPLLSIPTLSQFFGAHAGGQLFTTFLGYIWLTFAQLLFAAFAITQVARWSAEDSDGRLEVILSTPRSRASVVVERAVALTLGALLVATASGLAVGLAAHNQAVDINRERLAEGTLLLVPFALVFAAAGAVLAAWNPRAAVGLLGGLAFASYLLDELGPLFKWPTWVQDLSAFKLFGTPLSSGVDRGGLAIMIVIILVGFGASILLMERRDVGA